MHAISQISQISKPALYFAASVNAAGKNEKTLAFSSESARDACIAADADLRSVTDMPVSDRPREQPAIVRDEYHVHADGYEGEVVPIDIDYADLYTGNIVAWITE